MICLPSTPTCRSTARHRRPQLARPDDTGRRELHPEGADSAPPSVAPIRHYRMGARMMRASKVIEWGGHSIVLKAGSSAWGNQHVPSDVECSWHAVAED